jgi:hypothetical protein
MCQAVDTHIVQNLIEYPPKTDAADAQAIWTAVQQPEAHFVAVKTEQQQ